MPEYQPIVIDWKHKPVNNIQAPISQIHRILIQRGYRLGYQRLIFMAVIPSGEHYAHLGNDFISDLDIRIIRDFSVHNTIFILPVSGDGRILMWVHDVTYTFTLEEPALAAKIINIGE